ncbi:hypothetical protein DH2020_049973 [Rehmannia glutinosa]|uniref:Uncharacterized protein n=1 Tax=Rehmannia glutinosa TaxID=99300 RepID=A0ABR0U1A4_REHGL
MMLKQSSSRHLRAKSLKVKHALQILLLIAICIWLLYQVNKSYNKRKSASDERAMKVSENGENEYQIMNIGRKQLKPRVDEMAAEFEKQADEEVELDDDESKVRNNEETKMWDKEKIEEEGERDPLQDFVDEDDKDAQEK